MDRKEAAPRSGNYCGAKEAHFERRAEESIARDYGRGALMAGLLTAVSVGLCMVHCSVTGVMF